MLAAGVSRGASASVLVVRHLRKSFGKVPALRDVSFSVAEGEVFGFLGPNGAGKSTTIKIILGLLRADAGTVSLSGFDVRKQHLEAARLLGSATEVPGYYGYLTGRQNLRQFARTLGKPSENQLQELLDLVGLHDRGDDKVKRYSLGMRQRLSIAQALLGSPRVLVLDEPTNGLDPAGMYELRRLLRHLAKVVGMTVFFSSHLLAEVEEICDRVAVISRGEVRAVGPLSQLLATGSNSYELRVSDAAQAASMLQRLDGARVEMGPRHGTLRVEAGSDIGPLMLRALLDADIRVDGYSRGERRLEDLFLELTGASA